MATRSRNIAAIELSADKHSFFDLIYQLDFDKREAVANAIGTRVLNALLGDLHWTDRVSLSAAYNIECKSTPEMQSIDERNYDLLEANNRYHNRHIEDANKIAELEETVKKFKRLLNPVWMGFVQDTMCGNPPPDDGILFAFMGSGGSDNATVAAFREVMGDERLIDFDAEPPAPEVTEDHDEDPFSLGEVEQP